MRPRFPSKKEREAAFNLVLSELDTRADVADWVSNEMQVFLVKVSLGGAYAVEAVTDLTDKRLGLAEGSKLCGACLTIGESPNLQQVAERIVLFWTLALAANDLKGKPTLSVLDVALDYISRGWNPVPIKYREKRPIHDGWQKIVITAETAPQYFNGGNLNIGIQAGPHSRGLSDNDRDWPEAIVISPYIMPPTRSVFGRPSKRNSHALYYSPDLAGLLGGAALQRRHPATKEMIVELRAGGGEKGAQTVFPPSIHKETGEQISWEEDGEPATVDGATLIRCANEVAAYSLIARHWHGTAGRHHSAQVAGGFLARVGKSTAEIKLIVEAIAKAANDPEWREQVRTAADAADACAKGGNTRCIDEAKAVIERTKEMWFEANVHRIAGEVALMSSQPDIAKAEAYFERALAVARQQQAKSWELRASMSLARLWRSQGKVQQARELLAPVYGWFTEGFDTRDLKEAKALLEELAT
jgi:hypothetical protein